MRSVRFLVLSSLSLAHAFFLLESVYIQFCLCFQSFCSALALELTEYYRLIAVLEAQQSTGPQALTLKRLLVWTYDPLNRLKWLAVLVDGCKSK